MGTIHGLSNPVERDLARRLGVRQEASNFRTAVLKVLREQFTRDALQLFLPEAGDGGQHNKRLLNLGITGSWARTKTHPSWDLPLREKVCKILMKQRGVPERVDSGLAQGPQLVRPSPMPTNRPPLWRTGKLMDEANPTCQVNSRTGNHSVGYHAQCQRCRNVIVLRDKPVEIGRKSQVIKCPNCARRITASGMHCQTCLDRVSKCRCHVHIPNKRQSVLSATFRRRRRK